MEDRKKLKILFGLFLLALLVIGYQVGEIQEKNVEIQLMAGMKDWWYGAAVGCMETSGYWNVSQHKVIDDMQSDVFKLGRMAAYETISEKLNGSEDSQE